MRVLVLFLLVVSAIGVFFWLRPIYLSYHHGVIYEEMCEACANNNYQRVAELLRLGASPNGETDAEEADRYSFTAVQSYKPHIQQVTDYRDLRILRLLIAYGAHPDAQGDGEPFSALAGAIHEHRTGAVQVLLAAGANPRYTALGSRPWTAVDQARSLGYLDLVPIIEPYLESPRASRTTKITW